MCHSFMKGSLVVDGCAGTKEGTREVDGRAGRHFAMVGAIFTPCNDARVRF